ncbi:MAG TPA: hypothetical protein IAC14_00635 [Candidatus Scybalomonas excrementigallinarum]|jgi:purine-cytosine permease-like protein|nr:hypothetical protein [Candidatus Scybalomonas excrementigallinarum]
MQLFHRILAIITIIILIALFVTTCIFGITGNPNFFGMLALTIVVPVFLWALIFLFRKK